MAQGRNHWWADVNIVMNLQLRSCHLLKERCAARVSYVCRIDFLKTSFKSVYCSYPDKYFMIFLSLSRHKDAT